MQMCITIKEHAILFLEAVKTTTPPHIYLESKFLMYGFNDNTIKAEFL